MNPRRTVLFILAAALLAVVASGLNLARYAHTPKTVEGVVFLTIAPGDNSRKISAKIAASGLATWEFGNLVSLRLWGRPSALKAGVYRFAGEVSPVSIFDDVAAGRVDLVEITLPEGLTARQMAVELEKAGIITDSTVYEALAYQESSAQRWKVPGPTLEGYLFPDTYRFARGLDPEVVIGHMVRRFLAVAKELSPQMDAGKYTLGQWVTLASIIEKETGAADERPIIASVFLNRLKKRMRLESDPTVIYGIKDFDGNIKRKHLRQDTPYNTYTRRGIPPGPIASPGRESLWAVLNPAESDYLYFVSRNDGTHYFSRTYSEHTAAVRRFQLGGK